MRITEAGPEQRAAIGKSEGRPQGVFVEYTSSVCTRRRDAVVAVSTSNRFAALPDGVHMYSSIPDPFTRSRWNGYRAVNPHRGYGYYWLMRARVMWADGYARWHEVWLRVYVGSSRTDHVIGIKSRNGGY